MSLWNEYLARKLIFENHPLLDGERCLNHRQTRHPCTLCRDVCPEGVFTAKDGGSKEPDWELCSGCGLCVSACPSRAFTPSRLQTEKILSVLSVHHNDITISCKSDNNPDMFLETPGSLPWELLCCLAIQGRVILITGDCQKCSETSCRRILKENLCLAHAFFGGAPPRIFQTRDPSAVPPRHLTRREAIFLGVKKTGRTASALLPAFEAVPDGMVWRRILLQRLEQHAEKEVDRPAESTQKSGFSWKLPSFTEKCTACGICSRMCPSGAILRAQGPEGSGRFYMALLPEKCTGCGLCAKICPEGGMLAPVFMPIQTPVHPVLHAVSAVPCVRCNEPVPAGSGSSLCFRCRGESGFLRQEKT